jgi:MerR family transcriptional regulator/heat shock protein HspR
MTRPPDPRWTRLRLEAEPSAEPRYHLTAFAARAGLRVQTIRRYEAHGLIEPIAADHAPPRYSEADVERARRVRRLVDDLGVNLAGAAAILHLRDQLVALQRELLALHADQQSYPPR